MIQSGRMQAERWVRTPRIATTPGDANVAGVEGWFQQPRRSPSGLFCRGNRLRKSQQRRRTAAVAAVCVVVTLLSGCGQIAKNYWLDDLGACIPKGQAATIERKYEEPIGFETNYRVLYRLDDGSTCPGNITLHDYNRVERGAEVSRSSRSALCEKVFGTSCSGAVGRMAFIILCILVLLGAIVGIGRLLSLLECKNWVIVRRYQRLMNDPKSERIDHATTSFIFLIACLLWFGFLRGVSVSTGHAHPTWMAFIFTILFSVFAVLYSRGMGGREYFLHNLRVVALGSMLLWCVAAVSIVLGLDYGEVLRSLLSGISSGP